MGQSEGGAETGHEEEETRLNMRRLMSPSRE